MPPNVQVCQASEEAVFLPRPFLTSNKLLLIESTYFLYCKLSIGPLISIVDACKQIPRACFR